MATNLEIQAQIKLLMEEQNEFLEQQIKLNQDNLAIAKAMVEAIGKINYKDATVQLGEMNEAQSKAAESAESLGKTSQTTQEKVVKTLRDAAGQADFFGVSVTKAEKKVAKLGFVGVSALDGFISGLKLSMNLLASTTSLVGGMVGRLFDIGKSIITAPFKILNHLIGNLGSGSNELQQALEDIRKEFGNLHEAGAKAIIDTSKGMKGELANTGLSVYRVFGNLAERLKTVAEYAKNLGPLFGVLAQQFARNAEYIGAYYKGLGLTAEGQKAVAARAYATGQEIIEVSRQIANYSLQLGRSFGLNAKEISRDIGEMMADFSHFGNIAPRELAEISTYTRRLGIELKALAGVIDGLSNFEDAARSAAQLSQAFGLNIDAIQLMQEQNPARQVEMLRKSFFAAGRSIENMTRQERRLLAQQTHLDESTLDLVFSARNQGLTYDQVQRKGEAARKKQVSQAEAMQQLAGAIERLVKSGGAGAGGFFDRFVQGFERGIELSGTFRQLMRNLRVDLMATYRAGIQVGKEFVKAFPGVRDFIGGIADLFNPQRFRSMLSKVVASFRTFFQDLTTHPQTALSALLTRLKNGFFDWFNGSSPAGRRLINGFKSFFRSLSVIGASLLKEAMKGITVGIRFIVDLLTGRKNLSGIAAAGTGAGSFIARLLLPMVDAAKEMWPPLWDALKGLFDEVFKRVKGYLTKNAPIILGVLFGPAVLGAIARTMTAVFTTMITESVSAAIKNAGGGLKGISTILNGISKSFSGMFSGISATTAAVYALIAALVVLTVGFMTFPRQTQKIVDSIGDYVQKGAEKIFEFVGLAIGYLIKGIASIPRLVGGSFSNIPDLLQKAMIKFSNEFPTALEKAVFALGGIVKKAIFGILSGLEKGLTRALPQYTNQIKSTFTTIRDVVTKTFDFISSVSRTYFTIFKASWKVIGPVLGFVFRTVATVFQTQFRIISSVSSVVARDLISLWKTIGPPLTAVWQFIKSITVDYFTSTIKSARESYQSLVSGWNELSTFFSGLFNSISTQVNFFFNSFSAVSGMIWESIKSTWNEAGAVFTNVGIQIVNAIFSPLDRIKSKFEEVFGVARRSVESVSHVVNRIFGNSVHDIVARDLDQTRPAAERWSNNLIDAARRAENGITTSSRNMSRTVQTGIRNAPTGINSNIPGRQVANELNNTASLEAAQNASSTIQAIFSNLSQVLSNRNYNVVTPSAVRGLVDAIGNLQPAFQMLSLIPSIGTKAAQSVNQVAEATSSIQRVYQNISELTTDTRYNAVTATAVRDMITNMNQISQTLSNIQPITINSGLRRLAGNIGLGNNNELTIQHRNFNLQVNLHVKMDAVDLERILIERPNTRIATTTRTLPGTGD